MRFRPLTMFRLVNPVRLPQLICVIALLSGCDYAGNIIPDLNFDSLGKSDLDNLVRTDVAANFDFYNYPPSTVFSNSSVLVKDVSALLAKEGIDRDATAEKLQTLGARCSPTSDECTYRGIVHATYPLMTQVMNKASNYNSLYEITFFTHTGITRFRVSRSHERE